MDALGLPRPQILVVAPRFLPLIGGVATHVKAIVEALQDFDFVILKNLTPDEPDFQMFNARVLSVGPVWLEPARSGPGRGSRMVVNAVAERLRWRKRDAIATRLDSDVIHIHLIDQDYSWRVAGKLGFRKSIERMVKSCARVGGNPTKVVFTEHTILSAPDSIVPEYVKDIVLDAFENIICVERRSYARALDHRDRIGGPRNIWYIPNSVDTKTFSPQPFAKTPPLRVGVASRIDKPGYEKVVSLAHHLPDFAELWIAFAGDDQRIEEVRPEIGQDRVRLFVNTKPRDMPAFYSNIHVFFNQFPYMGIGRSTLEAMASGRPVIALDNDGVDKYPVSPQNGFLIREWPDDMFRILAALAEDRSLMESKGRSAREMIERALSDERLTPKLAAAYREIIEAST